MGRKKSEEKEIRKLTKIGKNSLGLTLPIDVVRKFGWKERQKVRVQVAGKKIVISDWEK